MRKENYELIVIGAGAAGMCAAINAARDGKTVLLLEKLSQVGAKLKATGGGKCNLTNTLSDAEFMTKFGRDGRFMQDALLNFSSTDLQNFMKSIGVATHAPDGFRVFPTTHSSTTIINAFLEELQRLEVKILTLQRVESLLIDEAKVTGVKTQTSSFFSNNVILATGGLGYPMLGAEGDGYALAKKLGHTITKLHPAMMPFQTKETWVAKCRANTIAKATLKVALKKHKSIKIQGDLIFTKTGIRGPAVLDFAREITPLLERYGEVPLVVNLTKGMDENEILQFLKQAQAKQPNASIYELIDRLLPSALSHELCKLVDASSELKLKELNGKVRQRLIEVLAWTPLTITGHDGFKMAMITRGGVQLKEVNPKTMQSKIISGLYFCGELLNLDGPCGGYNLQWSFSSGYLASKLYKS